MIHGADLTVRDQRAKITQPGVRKAVEEGAGGFSAVQEDPGMFCLSLVCHCVVRGVLGFSPADAEEAMDARCVSLEDTSPYQLQTVRRLLCCFHREKLEFPLFPAISDVVRLLCSWQAMELCSPSQSRVAKSGIVR